MAGRGGGALRRVLLAGTLYAILALLVGLPLVSVMRRALLLPPLFEPLAHGLLVLVGVVVVLAAWRDPEAPGRDGRGKRDEDGERDEDGFRG